MEIQPLTTYPAGAPHVSAANVNNQVAQETTTPAPARVAEIGAENTGAASLAAAEAEKGKQDKGEQLKEAVDKVSQLVRMMATDLRFSVDEVSGIHVVKVIDLATKDVIRQIPSEEMLAIARGLDRLQGLLLKQKV